MEYKGINKLATELRQGDFITITGYSADVSEIETVEPIGDKVKITLASGKSTVFNSNKLVRLYA